MWSAIDGYGMRGQSATRTGQFQIIGRCACAHQTDMPWRPEIVCSRRPPNRKTSDLHSTRHSYNLVTLRWYAYESQTSCRSMLKHIGQLSNRGMDEQQACFHQLRGGISQCALPSCVFCFKRKLKVYMKNQWQYNTMCRKFLVRDMVHQSPSLKVLLCPKFRVVSG